MLLDSQEPISEACAQKVEPAVAALLRLGITQQDVIEHLSRALGIVRCVLDYQQTIPRQTLADIGRDLWKRLPQLSDLPADAAERIRSTIKACVADIREIPESNGTLFHTKQPAPSLPAEPARPQLDSRFCNDRPHTANGSKGNGAPRPRIMALLEQRSLFDFQAETPADNEPQARIAVPAQPTVERPVPAEPIAIASGEKAKARDILAAVRVLKAIEKEDRPPTGEERKALARFAGFGPVALSIFPDPVTGRYKDAAWQEVGEELKSLLTPAEYESAKRTTFNAFYTSPTVIASMHAALGRLGVPTNAIVLEPGCGSGNFISLAPQEMRFIGVELDLLSGRIAQLRHPDQDIRIQNFCDTRLPEGSIDGVIGNVPFADLKLDYRGQKLSLHDYFFAKSVDALKPGGVVALVTSHFTLDKQNGALREWLASKADFVGAIRLPSDAFKREGTAVVTDIVFLRKRAADAAANHADPEWLGCAPLSIDGMEVAINRYFLNHPEMVLGTWSRKDTLYGEGYSVSGNGDIAGLLKAAVQRLPQFAPLPASTVQQQQTSRFAAPPPERYISEGSFVLNADRTICQVVEGQSVPVVYGGKTLRAEGARTGRRLAALIHLRDLARRVLQSQNEGWPEKQRNEARRELNWAYDRFSFAYGAINKTTSHETADGHRIRRMPNLVKFREDPDAMLVMSLEQYDETTDKASKAAIMQKDVVGKTPPITHVASAEEGLLVALNERGTVDVPFIGNLYGKPEEQVISELGDLVFHDPESGNWQTADAYLSGNVRAKLAAVLNAGASYARNAETLQKIQPEDVLPGEIDAHLGAPWIPESDIQAFAADLFRVELDSITIAHLTQDAVWSLDAGYAAMKSVAATSEFGTARANGTNLLEQALNMKTPAIYDTINRGDREEKILNREETLAAKEKQRQIKERFKSWVFTDPQRTERLVRTYNDRYNNLRPRLFDGSHLDFPGMNQTISLRQHQKDAIWRGMSSGNTLLAHAVGAGKTYTMAATGMKLRQAGLIQKPMFVVPNHLLEQFAREFMHLYPNAKLLIAAKEDLQRDHRKHLTAKIASGEWDGIIVTHSSFERIGMSRDYLEKFLLEQIAEYDRLLCEHAAARGANRNLIKTIEKQKAARVEKLKDLLAEEKKDDGLVFDELGVDHVFIDESQYFKNLETPTKMDRVAGIQTGGSERAFDVYLKAQYLHERHPGHGVTFATGTPISNTMVEMYTVQRFLDSEGLRTRGLQHFDAWAATFGEVIDTMEISPDGASLRPRSRFARFTNLPELQQMFRSFADVQTTDMLDLPRPELETGKAIVVACPMSEEQHALQLTLVERYERLRSEKIDPRVDNALNITTDGRKLAIDARMLAATAPDFPGSKVNALVANVASIWARSKATSSTQMIFSDMGVHPAAWGYCAYDDVIKKLVTHGIPPEQIAVIGDADSDAKKQSLFERVRSGQIRILLGSTQKMGTGTNVQKRLIALHHLDAPWKPAEVEQREGRILRQGNENKEVAIYRYVTERSFDSYMWQALETKARFIAQIMTGESAVRRAEDIGGHELSYAEVKAIASGNPAVLTLAEADAELQRLSLLKKNHLDEQYVARRSVRDLPKTISYLSQRVSTLAADQAMLTAHAADAIIIGSRVCSPADAAAVLGSALDRLPQNISESQRAALGVFRGLQFGLVLRPQFSPDVYLEGAAVRQSGFLSDSHGPRAILNALERLASGYEPECARTKEDLAIAEAQLRDYQNRLGKPFVHERFLSELTALRDQLKARLSVTQQESDGGPSTCELAERIKALKAANSIEAVPPRAGKLRAGAEEPVTTRIRRRMETTLNSEPCAPSEKGLDSAPLPHRRQRIV